MLSETLKTLAFAVPLGLAAPSLMADTFTGKLNGHGCAHAGGTCPTDRLDPHLALEPDFVLQKADGDYVFLSNVPRDTKVRYALETVQVTGSLNPKYQTVIVDEFRVKTGDKYVTRWSQAAQKAEQDYLFKEHWFQHN
jgi:hypothetical protein